MEELPRDDRYIVKLEVFEGPLDLLLFLIRKHEIDIFDIPISFITKKYLEYLELMKELNLDLASEYLEMAATLALIKSRMMLPAEPPGPDELIEDGPDPREELVRRLLEYQKYKTAAEQLSSMPMLGRDTFPRGADEHVSVERDLAAPGLFALMEAFQRILSGADLDPLHEVSMTRISVSARINELVDIFRLHQRRELGELFEGQRTKAELVVTFLAILEMVKLGLCRVQQEGVEGEIHITAERSLDDADRVVGEQTPEEE